jgi:RHS repeat-associated protein
VNSQLTKVKIDLGISYSPISFFSFNGKEKDDEVKGEGNSLDFGARIYDPRLGRWMSLDNMAAKYPGYSPYNFTLNNPIAFKDPDGNDVLVAFTGDFRGGGSQIKLTDAGTTGEIVLNAWANAINNDVEFNGAAFAPGMTSGSAVANAFDFVVKNYTKGEKVILYGYSNGGDFAVELASKLKGEGIDVDLLITVDAADGPLMGTTVDHSIPDNVKVNVNEYQTTNSSIGSRGDGNTADDATKTKVINSNLTNVKGVNHGSIDEIAKDLNTSLINKTVTGNGGKASFGTSSDKNGSSGSSSDSSSDSCSDSCFDKN